jgi:Astacin (Peptidase family M12A)
MSGGEMYCRAHIILAALASTAIMAAIDNSFGQDAPTISIADLIIETFPSQHKRYVYSDGFNKNFLALFSIVNLSRRWEPGALLRACFYGGDEPVNARISSVAKQWLDGVNISFNFTDVAEKPRDCSAPNVESNSEIRIGFSCSTSWALLGTEATDPSVSDPPECAQRKQTVNLSKVQRPDVSDSALNRDILHEFGHVLGFYHEHMRCSDEYDRDAMVSWLMINMNMSEDVINTQFYLPSQASDRDGGIDQSQNIDTKSIEFYSMPALFFKRKELSPCYVSPLPIALSEEDKSAAKRAYPLENAQIAALNARFNEQLIVTNLLIATSDLGRSPFIIPNAANTADYDARTDAANTQYNLADLREIQSKLRIRLNK